jgi:hypothetical protein
MANRLLQDKYNHLREDIRILDWDTLVEKHSLKLILEVGDLTELNIGMDCSPEKVRLAKEGKAVLLKKLTNDLGIFEVNQAEQFVQRGFPVFPGNKVIIGKVSYDEGKGWEFKVSVVPRWVVN